MFPSIDLWSMTANLTLKDWKRFGKITQGHLNAKQNE
jgi:hypothetical protein